jgi:hypothetical protein
LSASTDSVDGRWKAFFIDVEFKTETALGWPVDRYGTLEFTTGVNIVPNTFPYPDCQGAECQGALV